MVASERRLLSRFSRPCAAIGFDVAVAIAAHAIRDGQNTAHPSCANASPRRRSTARPGARSRLRDVDRVDLLPRPACLRRGVPAMLVLFATARQALQPFQLLLVGLGEGVATVRYMLRMFARLEYLSRYRSRSRSFAGTPGSALLRSAVRTLPAIVRIELRRIDSKARRIGDPAGGRARRGMSSSNAAGRKGAQYSLSRNRCWKTWSVFAGKLRRVIFTSLKVVPRTRG